MPAPGKLTPGTYQVFVKVKEDAGETDDNGEIAATSREMIGNTVWVEIH
jgi:hypothetical protein